MAAQMQSQVIAMFISGPMVNRLNTGDQVLQLYTNTNKSGQINSYVSLLSWVPSYKYK